MANPQSLRIGMVAGETSGDMLGAALIAALRRHAPNCEIRGIGGTQMQAAGMQIDYPASRLAVRGYWEVLRHLPGLLAIRRSIRHTMLTWRPDVFVGIDAPDFNLDLEASLREAGVRTVHYVSPSIWAWRMERLVKIKSAVDHMLLVFPFEREIYAEAGIPATYVGHPLADAIELAPDRSAARRALGFADEATLIALLPGSRESELSYMAPLFLEAAERLLRQHGDWQFVLPLANDEVAQRWRERFKDAVTRLPLKVLSGDARGAMTAANAVLAASGTATLEAALLKRPMVISYRVSALSYRLMWRQRRLPYVGLPNILAQSFVVPELLQDEATPERLTNAIETLLADSAAQQKLDRVFTDMHWALKQNSAERAAEVVLEIARKNHG